jgi:Skp family chaperone for outer membrane proteins
MYRFLTLLCLSLMLTVSVASGQDIYKHVGENGKVTYSNTPPTKRVDGREDKKAKKVTVQESTRGIEPAGKTGIASAKRAEQEGKAREAAASEARNGADDAKRALDTAKKAQKDGEAPLDSEWQTIAGGSRVPNEAYQERQKKLADAVKEAQQRFDEAQGVAQRKAN